MQLNNALPFNIITLSLFVWLDRIVSFKWIEQKQFLAWVLEILAILAHSCPSAAPLWRFHCVFPPQLHLSFFTSQPPRPLSYHLKQIPSHVPLALLKHLSRTKQCYDKTEGWQTPYLGSRPGPTAPSPPTRGHTASWTKQTAFTWTPVLLFVDVAGLGSNPGAIKHCLLLPHSV